MRLTRRGKRRLVLLLAVALIGSAGVFVFKAIGRAQQSRLLAEARVSGLAAYDRGDYQATLDALKYCIQYDRDDVDVLLSFADARSRLPLANDKHLYEAVSYYVHGLDLLEQNPDHPDRDRRQREALEALLALREALGHRFELLQIAEQLLALDADHLGALRAKAGAMFADRRFQDAAPVMHRLIDLDPDELRWRQWLLQMMRITGEPELHRLAQCDMWIAEHVEQDQAPFRLLKAQLLADLGRVDEAADEAARAADVGVNSLPILQQLVELLDALGSHDAASRVIAEAKQNFAAEPWVRQAAVQRLFRNGRTDDALVELAEAEQHFQRLDPILLRLKALALIEQQRADEAATVLGVLAAAEGREASADADRAWAEALLGSLRWNRSDRQPIMDSYRRAAQLNADDPVLPLLVGIAHTDLGEHALALQFYAQAYELDRNWVGAGLTYARALLAAGRFEEAFVVARETGAKAPPWRIEPYLLYAKTYLALQRIGRSPNVTDRSTGRRLDIVVMLQRLSEQLPDHSQATSLLAEAYVLKGQPADAAALMTQHVKDDQPDASVLLALADVSRRYGLRMERPLLRRAHAVDRNSLATIFAEAEALAAAGDADAGLALLDRAMTSVGSAQSNDETTRREYVRFLLRTKRPNALTELELLADQFADSPSIQTFVLAQPVAWNNPALVDRVIANLQTTLGEHSQQVHLARAARLLRDAAGNEQLLAEAVVLITGVLEQSPQSLAALSLLAEAYTRTTDGSTQQAIEYLQQAVDLYPAQAALYPRLIALLQQRGDFDTAAVYLRRLSELAELNVGLKRVELHLLQSQGDFETALVRAAALAGYTASETDQLALAAMYQRTGRDEDAEPIYKTLLSRADRSELVVVEAADFYARIDRFDEAVALLTSLNTDEVSADAATMIGKLYHRHGKTQQAESWLRKAVLVNPGYVEAWHVLARLYLAVDDTSQAYAAAQSGLRAAPDHAGLQAIVAIAAMRRDHAPVHSALELLSELGGDSENLASTLRLLDQIELIDGRPAPSAENLDDARRLVKEHARFLPAWLLAITLHVEAGKVSEAADLARRANGRFPTQPEPAQWATELLIAAGRWDEALAEAEEWRRRSLVDPFPAEVAAATVLLELARYDAAIDRLGPYTQRLLNEGNDHPDRLALWVRALLLGDRFDQAVSIVEPLFGDEAWRQRWLALARVVDISTAAEALNVIEPSMLREGADLLRLAVAFDALAVRSARADHFDHADALALRAAGDPKHAVDALLVRGRIAEGRSDWATAEQLYRRIITDQPDNAAALNNLAFVIAQSPTRLSEALAYIERAVALRPQQPDILDTYATVLHALGRLYEAHEALTQALAHRPADVAIRLNLVETVLAQGRLDDAWRMLQQIERTLSRRPQPDPRHLRRAEALRRRLDDAQTAAVVSDPQ